MKEFQFFKTLNSKINKYDKIASNPFENKRLVIVWVEEPKVKNRTE
jgi:hypothetical protein